MAYSPKLLIVGGHISLMAEDELAKMFPSKKHRELLILSLRISPFCIYVMSAYKSHRLMA